MEKVRIVRKPVVEGLPMGHHILFFGRINRNTYFVIHNSATTLRGPVFPFQPFIMMGFPSNLKEIGRGEMERYGGQYDYTNVKTSKGLFHFPRDDFGKSAEKTRPATFKGQPIEVFGRG